MASQVTDYKCPACGGPLHFVGSSGKLECDYCGGKYDVETVEKMLAEKNAKAEEAFNKASSSEWNTDSFSNDWGNGAEGMKTYSCPSCGAELICDETTAATCCPYCGNQTVVPGQFAGSLKPEYVIPFKTDKRQAKEALINHYKGKKLLPKSFVDGNHVEDIQGVYVPFWMFDCVAEGSIAYEATISETKQSGDKEITTTKHYDVKRSGNLTFEKVPVDASTKMPDRHMDSIEPYDYKELKPFSMAYMPGFLADKYDVTADECGKRMQERCEKTFEDEVTKTVTGYDSENVKSKNISIHKGTVHYAMLPVWLLATKWNDESFLFAMNGQSGKLVGDLPCDKGKYFRYFGGISAFIILIMQLMNNFVMRNPLTNAAMVLICILFPIFIAFLIVQSMKGKLKSVSFQKATSYMESAGLTLTVKEDKYVRTTTEEEKK